MAGLEQLRLRACVALFDALDTLPNSGMIERQLVAALLGWSQARRFWTLIMLKIPVPKRHECSDARIWRLH